MKQKVDIVNKKSPKNADEVFDAIHTIMHLFRSEQYRVLRDGPYDLTHMEGKLLGFFDRHPGATLGDLTKRSAKDKGQMAKLIKSLKAQGLLRATEDEKDRRSMRLSLTDAGKKVHRALQHQVERLSELAVKGLGAGERRQLVDLLERVRGNLDAVAEKDGCGGKGRK